MKHIALLSGGHSSAIVAIEVKRKFGKENVILLNHNINPRFENKDIKRFKKEISEYLDIPITYANYKGIINEEDIPSQFDIAIEIGGFKFGNGTELCTNRLKTKPFNDYLELNFPNKDCIVYYGFDDNEFNRVERRKTILNDMLIDSDYPLALWGNLESYKKYLLNQSISNGVKDIDIEFLLKIEKYIDSSNFIRTIYSTKEIGIEPPNTYEIWKHANCIGCLKAGKQHWYCVYVNDNEVFEIAKKTEDIIGYSIIKGEYLKELEHDFYIMKKNGVPANEHIDSSAFWKTAKNYTKKGMQDLFPCECWSI